MDNNIFRYEIKLHLSLLVMIVLPLGVCSQYKDNRIFNDSLLKISEININSKLSDFGPSIVQDSLYFTTYDDNQNGNGIHKKEKIEFYKLYKAAIDRQGNPISTAYSLEPFITQFNEGPVAWCEKTGELFVTVNYIDQSLKSKKFKHPINRLRIVIAKQINGKWKQISEFTHNNPDYSVGHAAITQSGDTLVFSSDKPGGFGETDLYYSVRINGNWENPVNLGPKINTPGKEEFASFTNQQSNGNFLIFSSTGREGLGGLDLYYSRFPSDFSHIVHFNSPVNSASDDFAMTIPNDAEYGYLTSNRKGTGDDDIYKFTFKKINRLLPKEKFMTLMAFDKASKRPLTEVVIVGSDNVTYKTDKSGKVDHLPVKWKEYEVKASAFGYQEKTKILHPNFVNDSESVNDTIWMDLNVNKKIALKNIYFDFDKWDILPESGRELDLLVSLMKENPGMNVVLSSHTDDRGTEIYNLKLSQLRAESSVNYVVAHGIDQTRITGMGYGKTQLINKSINGAALTPEQNRENRRTEIYIPGFARGESVKQKAGDFSDINSIVPVKSIPPKPVPTDKVETQNVHLKAPGKVADTKSKSDEETIKLAENQIEPAGAKVKPAEVNSKFFVILGSFQDKKVADDLVNKLKTNGIKCVIRKGSGQFRVGIPYADYDQATKGKDKMKSKYKTAWILIE